MAQDGSANKTRVFFAGDKSGAGASLLGMLSDNRDFEVKEFSGSPDDIFQQAVAKSADLVVLLFPALTDKHERCIRLVLRSTFSHILLLTADNVPEEIKSEKKRVNIYRVSASQTNFNGAYELAVALSDIRHRPSAKRTDAAQQSDSAAETQKSSVLLEGALATKIVAVGASTGGTEALATFFRGLKPTMPGIVVVQHMPPGFTDMFAKRLDKELPFDVCEAKDNTQIKLNSIHIAPGDRHLTVKKIGSNYYTVLGNSEKVGGHCPAVDVLFHSVAAVAGSAATGVILTGMGGDGAEGMLAMRERGAFTVGQDEKSCVVYGMPRKAYEIGAVARQAPLGDIAGILMTHLGTNK